MKKMHHHMTLGDLILAVGTPGRHNRQTVAAVTDLLGHSRARLQAGHRASRR